MEGTLLGTSEAAGGSVIRGSVDRVGSGVPQADGTTEGLSENGTLEGTLLGISDAAATAGVTVPTGETVTRGSTATEGSDVVHVKGTADG